MPGAPGAIVARLSVIDRPPRLTRRPAGPPARASDPTFQDSVGLRGPQAAGLVLVDRVGALQCPVDDPPSGLHRVLAGEQRLVAPDRVTDQALVGRTGVGSLMSRHELDRVADHVVARRFRPGDERDRHVWRQPESEVVTVGGLGRGLAEDVEWRSSELDQHLGRGHWHRLAGPDVERHTGPAPGVEYAGPRTS